MTKHFKTDFEKLKEEEFENKKSLRSLFLGILVSAILFIILTIPHISLFMFGYGFKYPSLLVYIIAFFSGLSGVGIVSFFAPKIAKKLFN